MDVVSMFRHLGRIVINNTSPRQGAVLRGRCEWYAVPKAPLFSDVTDVDWFCVCTTYVRTPYSVAYFHLSLTRVQPQFHYIQAYRHDYILRIVYYTL